MTLPSTFTSVTISPIRLIDLMSVDLPQPDGPMMAVTLFSGMSRLTPDSA
jgi:hypothetical protein